VEEIAKKIAEIKNISFEEVAHKTTENAVSLFNIKTA
jgi:Tat protein secretion system quality control protein TatD with DNase activity